MKKTKELRAFLIRTMQRIEKGEISPSDGRNIVGCMNQINISINTELKARNMALNLGEKVEPMGEMVISE
jgi:hypothetical protein